MCVREHLRDTLEWWHSEVLEDIVKLLQSTSALISDFPKENGDTVIETHQYCDFKHV